MDTFLVRVVYSDGSIDDIPVVAENEDDAEDVAAGKIEVSNVIVARETIVAH